MFARYSPVPPPGTPCVGCSSTSSRTRCLRSRGSRGAEGTRAAELYERIFLGYGDDSVAQLGGRPRRDGVDVEPADEDPAAAAARRVPRAVDALHRVRLATRGVRVSLSPGRAFRPRVRARDGRSLRDVQPAARGRLGLGRGRVPRASADESAACAHARPCGRRRSIWCAACCRRRRSRTWDVRERPDLRAARAAPARASAGGGASVWRDAARGAAEDHPELRHAVPREDRGGPLDRVPARAAHRRGTQRLRGSGSRTTPLRLRPLCGCSARTARRRSSSRSALRVVGAIGRKRHYARVPARAGEARRAPARADRGAREPPAPAGPRLRDAYLSLRDRLRLRRVSANLQGTGCSPASGSGSPPISAAASRTRWSRPGSAASTKRALEVSRVEHARLRAHGLVEEAPYALASRSASATCSSSTRARAMHLIELRSGREGHPSYRAVAHEYASCDRRWSTRTSRPR